MEEVVILSAVRTPIGSLNGCLSTFKASELGSIVITEVLRRANLPPECVSEVIFGHVLTAGQGQNPARQASIAAGIPHSVPACTVNQVCGSGLRAIAGAYQAVRCGDSKVVVAGGQESMSKAQHAAHTRSGLKFGDMQLKDTILSDGLMDAMNDIHMGITAENVSRQFGISREMQDEFALSSQLKCEQARSCGHFDEEIVPVQIKTRQGSTNISKDEFPRSGCTLEGLQRLKPIFLSDSTGTVTAGNASGINDGAAALLIASGSEVERLGSAPLARIVGWHQVGIDPKIMGMGPVDAVRGLAEKTGWSLSEVDLFEINEAFACQSSAVIRELDIDPRKVNISGGAISLGHPIGASGARIVVTLLYNLKRLNLRRGIAALCVGGGMGVAMAVER